MGFTTAKLGDQGHDRCGVHRLAGEPTQHHAGMFTKRPRKTGAAEELFRIPVVFRGGFGDDLFKVDGEFIRVE